VSDNKEQNSLVYLIAVVAIVGSALASGMVVYKWQKAKLSKTVFLGTNFFGTKAGEVSPPSTVKTSPGPTKTSSSSPAASSSPNSSGNATSGSSTPGGSTENSPASAKLVLENFFKYLSEGNFDKAAENYQYDETEGALSVFADYMDNYKMANTLRNFCEVQSTCLPVRIISQEEIEDGYQFKVNFIKSDGSTYRYEIGGTISEEAFDYKVKLFHGQYRVVTPPLFHP